MLHASCFIDVIFHCFNKPLRQLLLCSILIGCFTSCQQPNFPPPGSQPMSVDLTLRPFWLGLCEEASEGEEEITIAVTVNTVDVAGLLLSEFSYDEFRTSNSEFAVTGESFLIRTPTSGYVTIEVTARLSCSSCCTSNPGGNYPAPNNSPDPVVCGSTGGLEIAGQPRFVTTFPALDLIDNNGSGIEASLSFRGCLVCGCVD